MISINDIKKKYYDRLSNNKDVMKVYNAITEEFIAHTMKEARDLDEIINNIVEGTKENSKGVFTYKTTRVLGKGQVYIIEKLKECFK